MFLPVCSCSIVLFTKYDFIWFFPLFSRNSQWFCVQRCCSRQWFRLKIATSFIILQNCQFQVRTFVVQTLWHWSDTDIHETLRLSLLMAEFDLDRFVFNWCIALPQLDWMERVPAHGFYTISSHFPFVRSFGRFVQSVRRLCWLCLARANKFHIFTIVCIGTPRRWRAIRNRFGIHCHLPVIVIVYRWAHR